MARHKQATASASALLLRRPPSAASHLCFSLPFLYLPFSHEAAAGVTRRRPLRVERQCGWGLVATSLSLIIRVGSSVSYPAEERALLWIDFSLFSSLPRL